MNRICSKSVSKICYLFLFFAVNSIYAQTSVNFAEKFPDYEYGLGKGVGFALARDCSAGLASIENVEINQSPIMVYMNDIRVKFSVIEYYRFTDDKIEDEPEIDFSYLKEKIIKKRVKPTYNPFEWRLHAEMIQGNKAMIFYCKDGKKGGNHKFITTDVAYFDKIKQAINLTEQFRTDSGKLLDYFANEYKSDNELRKSVALNFLFGINESYSDIGAYIFVSLLNETPLKNQKDGFFIRTHITSALRSKKVTIPDLRKQSFTKLVRIANGENENAKDATLILAKIAVSNSEELKPYIESEQTGNISTNLQIISKKFVGINFDLLMQLLSER